MLLWSAKTIQNITKSIVAYLMNLDYYLNSVSFKAVP